MNPIIAVKVFYKNDRGNLIAVQRQNKRANWYRYTYERSSALGVLCMNWNINSHNIDKTHYAIVLRKVE